MYEKANVKCALDFERLERAENVWQAEGNMPRNVHSENLTEKRLGGRSELDRAKEDVKTVNGTVKLKDAIDCDVWRDLVRDAIDLIKEHTLCIHLLRDFI